jgi:alkylated DNA repair dioxygenase AlkB
MLDAASWVDHACGWYAKPQPLFDALAEGADWEQRSRWMFTKNVIEPRLTAEFHVLEAVPIAELRDIGARLSESYGVHYDSAWLNLYRDENDSTSWHADRPACHHPSAIVPVLSLGATRRFVIRPKDGGRSVNFTVASGDLIVMGGQCQRDWEHAVPRETTPAGARIIVNFGSGSRET